jgi:mono/diheme cytochrome c family protein
MRKYFILMGAILSVLILANCNGPKKVAATPVPKSTYTGDLSAVIMNNCVPCHIPAKGGRKKAYDNYANVKTDIDDIIKRIELNPTDRGFMPFKGNAKLPDSTIAKFKKWRDDGLLETK